MPRHPQRHDADGAFSGVLVQVSLPSALTGQSHKNADPEIQALHDELTEVNRAITSNDLGIPPEGERSPSPEPIYDRCQES